MCPDCGQHLCHPADLRARWNSARRCRSTASPNIFPDTATCSAASWSPTPSIFAPLRSLSRTARPQSRPVRIVSRDARYQDFPAAHGAAVRQRLPRRVLAGHASRVERVYFPADPKHPDADNIRRVFAPRFVRRHGEFEVKDADRAGIFRFMNALKMVVPDFAGRRPQPDALPGHGVAPRTPPKHRERLGIRENLLRFSVGIEDIEDIVADLDQALRLHV